MPIVFIHGVTGRDNIEYVDNMNIRNSYFRRFLLPGIVSNPSKVKIFEAIWGEEATVFHWRLASLSKDLESLGTTYEQLPLLFLNQAGIEQISPTETNKILVQVFQKAFNQSRNEGKDEDEASQEAMLIVVNLLWQIMSLNDKYAPEELSFLAAKAIEFIQNNYDWEWIQQINNDERFLQEFETKVKQWQLNSQTKYSQIETLGFSKIGTLLRNSKDILQEQVQRVTNIHKYIIGSFISQFKQPQYRLALFLGDVFTYLNLRGTSPTQPGNIIQKVVEKIEAAIQQKNEDDNKLIVIAHSMGGNIIYDILTHFRTNLEIDILITVGSQVAFFEEIKLFKASDPNFPQSPETERLKKPENVGRWINAFDNSDLLGLAASGVFSDVEEVPYSTGTGVESHSEYFNQPLFHIRLNKAVLEQS